MHPESGEVASQQVEVQGSHVQSGHRQNCPYPTPVLSATSLDFLSRHVLSSGNIFRGADTDLEIRGLLHVAQARPDRGRTFPALMRS